MTQVAAGEITIKKVAITSYAGAVVDITDLVLEINVYEDIFSPTMTGNLVIVDAVGLLSTLPVIGQEKLEIQISSPLWNTVKYEFQSYSVSDRVSENQTTATYILNFVSKEAIDDKMTRISKSYRGTHGAIAQSVFKDWLSSKKNFSVENTSHNTSFIVPYWSPFETINYLAARSLPNYTGAQAGMLFYENNSGYRFESIQTMFGKESLGQLQYRDSNVQTSTAVPSKIGYAGLTIEDYDVIENMDTLKALSNGLVGTSLYSKDLTKNTWSKNDWNYLKEFAKSKHLNSKPVFPNTNAFGNRFASGTNEARLAFTHNNMFTGIEDGIFPKEWVASRMSLMQQLQSTRLNISVPGHILMSAGAVINLLFPSNAPVSKGNNATDKTLTGKYLIAAVRHNFQMRFHRVTFEAVKESTEGLLS